MSKEALKIGYHIPNVNDATAFYRTIGPLNYAYKNNLGITYEALTSVTYPCLSRYDVILVQRPSLDSELKLIEYCKKIPNLKVWVDFDDDVFHVPSENPSYELYNREATKKVVARSLYLADKITVSTKALKNVFTSFLHKTDWQGEILLSPNALPMHLLKEPKDKINREDLIVWRGGGSHVKDLLDYKDIIAESHKKYPDFSWLFIGLKPWFLVDIIPESKLLYQPPMEILDYFNMIYTIKPKAFFVALTDNIFNKSKSNIAALEAFYAGASCIAPPNFPEFDIFGCMKMDKDNPLDAIDKALELSDTELNFMSKKALQKSLSIADKSLKLVEFLKRGVKI